MFAGIMMIFLLVAITFIFVSQNKTKELIESNKKLVELNRDMSEILEAYAKLQLDINNDLVREFSGDFGAWNASIDDTNTIRFNELDAIFELGKSELTPNFKAILDDFFPRYMKIMNKYRDDIEAIIIEGHASNIWRGTSSKDDSFLYNASLSQNRALNVLRYCFANGASATEREWLMGVFQSNGLSFSKPLQSEEMSRRVEFRVVTKVYNNIKKVIDTRILK
ncbi:hypothetical protein CCY99_07340 [Helicobacter sp. 16-1353]|nr:hypothetical protein CCY99_07340 [Helicobacter sp. 16-1353]